MDYSDLPPPGARGEDTEALADEQAEKKKQQLLDNFVEKFGDKYPNLAAAIATGADLATPSTPREVGAMIALGPAGARIAAGKKLEPAYELTASAKDFAKRNTGVYRMPIDDFLEMTTKAGDKELAGSFKHRTHKEFADFIKKNPDEASSQYLNYDMDGNVIGHEGRHRAIAAKTAGYDDIDVVLSRYPSNAYNTAELPEKLSGQFKNAKVKLDPVRYTDMRPPRDISKWDKAVEQTARKEAKADRAKRGFNSKASKSEQFEYDTIPSKQERKQASAQRSEIQDVIDRGRRAIERDDTEALMTSLNNSKNDLKTFQPGGGKVHELYNLRAIVEGNLDLMKDGKARDPKDIQAIIDRAYKFMGNK
jgi:hypothetical protein